jgi:cytochrome P450
MEASQHAAAMQVHPWPWTSAPLGPVVSIVLALIIVLLLLLSLWFVWSSNGNSVARRSAAAAGIAPLPLDSAPSKSASKLLGDTYSPPTTLPLLGNLIDLAQHTERFHDLMAELAQQSDGRPVRLKLPGKPDMLMLSTPAQFEAVQKHQLDNFVKGDSLHYLLLDLMGDGIFTVNGDKWKRQRQILVRLFTARSLRDHITPIIRKNTRTLLSILDRVASQVSEGKAKEATGVVDLVEMMHQLTLDSFVELAFGVQLGGLASMEQAQDQQEAPETIGHRFQRAFDTAQFLMARRFMSPSFEWKLKRWLNIGSERRLRDAMAVVNEMAYGLISKCIELRQPSQSQPTATAEASEPGRQKHLVDLLLDVADAEGLDFTPTQVRDLVVNALVAGRDTTAESLCWTFHLLHQHPRVVAALRDELRRAKLPIGGDQSEPYIPTMDDVQALPYLEATIREGLRMYPPASFTVKHCIKDSWLPTDDKKHDAGTGTFVPAGTDVAVSVYAMGRLPRVWGSDAAQFRPERFLDETTGKLLPMSPFRFSAFSGGPRVCVGQALAMLQVKLVLVAVVARFDISELPGQEVTYTSGITLPMKNPLRVRATQCR